MTVQSYKVVTPFDVEFKDLTLNFEVGTVINVEDAIATAPVKLWGNEYKVALVEECIQDAMTKKFLVKV